MTANPIAKLTKSRLLLIGGAFLYLLVIHIVYIYLIAPWWSYLGFVYVIPFSVWKIIGVTLLGILPAFWLPIACDRPSQVVNWILYLFVVVPITMMPFYAPHVNPNVIASFQVSVLLAYFGLGFMCRLPKMAIVRFELPISLFWYLVLMLMMLFLGYIGLKHGFRLQVIDLLFVRDVRFDYRDFISSSGTLIAYLLFWSGNVIVPLVLVRSLVGHYWIPFCFAVLAQLFLFSVGGHRTILFSILLLSGIVEILRRNNRLFGLAFLYGMIVTVLVSGVLDIGLNIIPPPFTTTITRRLIIAPGVLSSFYLDFFSQNPKALLGWSFLRNYVEYPYPVAPSFLIGSIYMHNSEVSANANFWADAYANFDYVGIFAFTLILGLFLWLLDSVSEGKNKLVTLPLVSMSAFLLTNTALFTALLSHGLLIALLLIWLMPREGAIDQLAIRFRHY